MPQYPRVRRKKKKSKAVLTLTAKRGKKTCIRLPLKRVPFSASDHKDHAQRCSEARGHASCKHQQHVQGQAQAQCVKEPQVYAECHGVHDGSSLECKSPPTPLDDTSERNCSAPLAVLPPATASSMTTAKTAKSSSTWPGPAPSHSQDLSPALLSSVPCAEESKSKTDRIPSQIQSKSKMKMMKTRTKQRDIGTVVSVGTDEMEGGKLPATTPPCGVTRTTMETHTVERGAAHRKRHRRQAPAAAAAIVHSHMGATAIGGRRIKEKVKGQLATASPMDCISPPASVSTATITTTASSSLGSELTVPIPFLKDCKKNPLFAHASNGEHSIVADSMTEETEILQETESSVTTATNTTGALSLPPTELTSASVSAEITDAATTSSMSPRSDDSWPIYDPNYYYSSAYTSAAAVTATSTPTASTSAGTTPVVVAPPTAAMSSMTAEEWASHSQQQMYGTGVFQPIIAQSHNAQLPGGTQPPNGTGTIMTSMPMMAGPSVVASAGATATDPNFYLYSSYFNAAAMAPPHTVVGGAQYCHQYPAAMGVGMGGMGVTPLVYYPVAAATGGVGVHPIAADGSGTEASSTLAAPSTATTFAPAAAAYYTPAPYAYMCSTAAIPVPAAAAPAMAATASSATMSAATAMSMRMATPTPLATASASSSGSFAAPQTITGAFKRPTSSVASQSSTTTMATAAAVGSGTVTHGSLMPVKAAAASTTPMPNGRSATTAVSSSPVAAASTTTTAASSRSRVREEIVECRADLQSRDISRQLRGVSALRMLLSDEHMPPIDEVIEAKCLPRLIRMLRSTRGHNTLLFETAWVLTNICSGSHKHTMAVVNHTHGIESIVDLLKLPDEAVLEQAIWVLGNIAGDGALARDICLRKGVLRELIALVRRKNARRCLLLRKSQEQQLKRRRLMDGSAEAVLPKDAAAKGLLPEDGGDDDSGDELLAASPFDYGIAANSSLTFDRNMIWTLSNLVRGWGNSTPTTTTTPSTSSPKEAGDEKKSVSGRPKRGGGRKVASKKKKKKQQRRGKKASAKRSSAGEHWDEHFGDECVEATEAVSGEHKSAQQYIGEHMDDVIEIVLGFLQSSDTEVLTDTCWALSYLSDGCNENIEKILQISEAMHLNVCQHLVSFLEREEMSVLVPALRTCGNIVSGSDAQTQAIMDAGLLDKICHLFLTQKLRLKSGTGAELIGTVNTLWMHQTALAVFGDMYATQQLQLAAASSMAASTAALASSTESSALAAHRPATASVLQSQATGLSTSVQPTAAAPSSCYYTAPMGCASVAASASPMAGSSQSVLKEAIWTISNITAGSCAQIELVIQKGLLLPLVEILCNPNSDCDLVKECIWAICNATSGGSHSQRKYLVQFATIGLAKVMTHFAKPRADMEVLATAGFGASGGGSPLTGACANRKLQLVLLEGLENLLCFADTHVLFPPRPRPIVVHSANGSAQRFQHRFWLPPRADEACQLCSAELAALRSDLRRGLGDASALAAASLLNSEVVSAAFAHHCDAEDGGEEAVDERKELAAGLGSADASVSSALLDVRKLTPATVLALIRDGDKEVAAREFNYYFANYQLPKALQMYTSECARRHAHNYAAYVMEATSAHLLLADWNYYASDAHIAKLARALYEKYFQTSFQF